MRADRRDASAQHVWALPVRNDDRNHRPFGHLITDPVESMILRLADLTAKIVSFKVLLKRALPGFIGIPLAVRIVRRRLFMGSPVIEHPRNMADPVRSDPVLQSGSFLPSGNGRYNCSTEADPD